ncbi:aldo/keto reductase [Streptomyces scabiei]|uniref:aldo/keto reductase n=1 Tax=Streptomyces scabiei TaxID=1930 RepID=UPI0038F7EAA3
MPITAGIGNHPRRSGLPDRGGGRLDTVRRRRRTHHHPAVHGREPGGRALVEHIGAVAAAKDATPGQVALAWLLARHPSIVPIPGTRRITRVEENADATRLPLSADEPSDLDELAGRIGVEGARYNEHHMSLVDR